MTTRISRTEIIQYTGGYETRVTLKRVDDSGHIYFRVTGPDGYYKAHMSTREIFERYEDAAECFDSLAEGIAI